MKIGFIFSIFYVSFTHEHSMYITPAPLLTPFVSRTSLTNSYLFPNHCCYLYKPIYTCWVYENIYPTLSHFNIAHAYVVYRDDHGNSMTYLEAFPCRKFILPLQQSWPHVGYITIFNLVLLYGHGCFACVNVCKSLVCLVSAVSRRGCQLSGICS